MVPMDEVIKVANRSSIRSFKTGAVIWSYGRIVSNGWSHVPHYKLRSKRSLHAEMHALARARHLDLEGCDIAIATLSGKSGNIVGAKPCLDCAIALKAAGIRFVHYTVTGSDYRMMDLSNESIFEGLKVYEHSRD